MILLLSLWNLFMMKDICIYQQNRYQKDRYLQSIHVDWKKMMLFMGCVMITWLLMDHFLVMYLLMLILFPTCYKENRRYIKECMMTKRITRLFGCILLTDVLLFLISLMNETLMIFIMMFLLVFHHECFFVFVYGLHPLETRIRKNYVEKAKRKLEKYTGIIIGITGSYGKTSIKNLLYDVLSMKYSCLKTPHSYNNEMGITKTILENLKHQQVFICEMGADHLHEIEDLCAFVQPHYGIVSSIGPQHLSTFKTMENILYEKLQLLESLPADGVGFYNLDNHYLKEANLEKMKCRCLSVGIQNKAEYSVTNMQWDHLGSHFDVFLKGKNVHFSTSLLGEHNILNCLFAIAVADVLHVDPVLMQMALARAKATEHRLELKPFYAGMCIDNAYNSNPESARCALEVLKKMPGRHLIITPGFLDLGEHDQAYSVAFGKQMSFCDIILLIGNCKDIKKGIEEMGKRDSVFEFNTMKEALTYVQSVIREKDTLLIENDIPEILNQKTIKT